jgi:hypothetical protein
MSYNAPSILPRKKKLSFVFPNNKYTSKVLASDNSTNQVFDPITNNNNNNNFDTQNIRIEFKENPLSRNTKTKTWRDMFKSRRKITPSNFRAGKKKTRKNRTKSKKYNNIKKR